jgi:hypothetical protein
MSMVAAQEGGMAKSLKKLAMEMEMTAARESLVIGEADRKRVDGQLRSDRR